MFTWIIIWWWLWSKWCPHKSALEEDKCLALVLLLADCQGRNSRVETAKRLSSSSSSSISSSLSSSTLSSSNSKKPSPSSLTSSSYHNSSSSSPRSHLPPHHHHRHLPHHHLPYHQPPHHPAAAYASSYSPYPGAHAHHAAPPTGLNQGPCMATASAQNSPHYGSSYLGSASSHHHHFVQPSSTPLFSPYNR